MYSRAGRPPSTKILIYIGVVDVDNASIYTDSIGATGASASGKARP